MRLTLVFALAAAAGCTTPDSPETPADTTDDPGSPSEPVFRLEPSNPVITVVDGNAVMQNFAATLDGVDVTTETTFTLEDAEFGRWYHDGVQLAGDRVGVTRVVATYRGREATTSLRVNAHTTLLDTNTPVEARERFATAVDHEACAPELVYPKDGTVQPRNVPVDVMWNDDFDQLFDVSFESEYATVDVLTTRTQIDAVSARLWNQLSSSGAAVTMRVRGLAANSTVACSTARRSLQLTDDNLAGAVYYTTEGSGVSRFDLATFAGESLDAAPFSSCTDCAVSRSGSRLAVMLDSGEGAIVDFAQNTLTTPMVWESVTFLGDETKLIISTQHQLFLVDDIGSVLQTIPATWASDPQMSPNDSMLAYVDGTETETAVMLRSHAPDSHEIGEARVLVPSEPGVLNAAPAFSPDGEWLAYTRMTTGTAGETLASIWVTALDGRMPPIQVTAPTEDRELVARWAPFEQTASEERVMFLTFDANWLMGRQQIWMTAFLPSRGTARPPLRLPFQSSTTANHVATWAEQMVR